ncbi:MAG: molybdopterin-binding protein [Candidatus Bathyarchaeia archaeon]
MISPLKAEVIAVGDELCYGRVYDTNSFWLADQLTHLGVLVRRITCIRDDEEEICHVLMDSIERQSDFIFITGGLGPTQDDRTLEALSKVSGRRVIVSETILNIISQRRGIPPKAFLPHQLKMISTLEGAECLPNPAGWAPVTIFKLRNSTIFAFPGPPKEVQACFNEYIGRRIGESTGLRSLARRIYVDMYESELSPLVKEVVGSFRGVYIKPLVSEVREGRNLAVEIITFDGSEEGCQKKYEQTLKRLRDLVAQMGRTVLESR